MFLLRKQHSIQQYNGLHNWFDRNRSSNGLDQRCQDLQSLSKLEDKSGIDLQFSSIQGYCSPEVKLPMTMDGQTRHPLIRKWENTGQISFEHAEAAEGCEISNGYKLETFWNLLDEELKPKGNKLLSVIELWTQSKQGSKSLNEWLTHVHNLAELCDYPATSKERIIRDVLIINCSNEKAKDKIIQKGHEIKLEEVIGILQTEDSTQRTLQEMNLETKKLHYASYDKKKSGSKGNKKTSFSSPAPKSSGSTSQSISSGRLCYRCRKPYTKEHEAVCKVKTAKCNGCGEIGYYKNCCKKAGNFPKKPQHAKKMHITGIAEQEF